MSSSDEPPTSDEPHHCPVLDAELVRELQGIEDESGLPLFERLGRKVMLDVGIVLAQLAASRSDLTTSVVAILAHRAKGDCLTIGARAAARAAGALEDAALGGEKDEALRALDELRAAWVDARLALEGALARRRG